MGTRGKSAGPLTSIGLAIASFVMGLALGALYHRSHSSSSIETLVLGGGGAFFVFIFVFFMVKFPPAPSVDAGLQHARPGCNDRRVRQHVGPSRAASKRVLRVIARKAFMKKLVRAGAYVATAVISLILGFWLSGMLPYQGNGAVVGLMFGGFIGCIVFGLLTPASDARPFRLLSLTLCMFFLGMTAQGFHLIGRH